MLKAATRRIEKAQKRGGQRRPTSRHHKKQKSLKWFGKHKVFFCQHGFDWPPLLQTSEAHLHSERESEIIQFQKFMLERQMGLSPEVMSMTLAFDSSQSVDRVPQASHGVLPCWCPHSKVHQFTVSRRHDMLAFDRRRIMPAEALQLQGAVFLFNILLFVNPGTSCG